MRQIESQDLPPGRGEITDLGVGGGVLPHPPGQRRDGKIDITGVKACSQGNDREAAPYEAAPYKVT